MKIPTLEEKTKSVIYTPDQDADFLGLAMVRKTKTGYALEVSAQQMTNIRTELFKLTDLSELNKRGIDFFKFGQALDSRIGGYSAAYSMCNNFSDFDTRLKQIRDKIYKTVLENLGIKPATLSANARQFFHL